MDLAISRDPLAGASCLYGRACKADFLLTVKGVRFTFVAALVESYPLPRGSGMNYGNIYSTVGSAGRGIVVVLCLAWAFLAGNQGAQAQTGPATLGAPRATLSEATRPVETRQELPYVVLENGRLLRGTVTRDKTDAVIKLQSGGAVRLPWERIRAVANSLPEAFQLQRAQLIPRDVNGHVDLCEWCLRNRLYSEASLLLRAIRTLKDDGPTIASLERRLKSGMEAEVRRVNDKRLRAKPNATQPTSDLANEGDADVVTELTRATFHQQIHPILVNRCAAGGCHGKSGNGLLVQRPPQGQLVSRRLSNRNLERVGKYIGENEVLDSTLFRMAISDHTGDGPPLKNDNPAAQALMAWILQWQRDHSVTAKESPVDENETSTSDSSSEPSVGGEIKAKNAPQGIQGTDKAVPLPSEATDPYDPSEFNRRVRG